MSYNWTSAATPQGRERLEELMDSGITVVGRSIDGMHDDECYFIDPEYDMAGDESLEYLQFLDPSPTQPKADKTHDQLGFGDYVCIEQFRYGVPHEFFQYKVVGTLRSNCWVDTPIKHTPTAVRHDSMDDVILCICCGIDETKVDRFRLLDVVPHGRYWELNRPAGKETNP